nr:4'-phosphopantetheinyltransferase 7N [uncultured bacterium]
MAALLDVHIVYRVTRYLADQQLSAERACLSADEEARAAQFAFADDRRDFIAAHALLRQTLSAHAPRDPSAWTFSQGPYGKPVLADGSDERTALTFNLSHTRGLVACVVSRNVDVGIDVERTSQSADALDVARDRFSSREVRSLEECDHAARSARFTELWTLKEAYAKAKGTGVLGGMDVCTFTLGPTDSLCCDVVDRGGPDAWLFAVFGVLDYRLAVAVHDPEKRCGALSVRHARERNGGDERQMRLLRRSKSVVVTD